MTEEINDIVKNYLTTNYPKYLYNKNFVPGKSQVLYSGPYWDEKEILAMINTILNGKWFVAGENVYKFEREFAKRFGVEYSHMVNSGSSANLVMMAALKKYFQWEDGSEIIVSPVGFPTTISAIVQNNMIPVFIDIEFDTLNFNINKIEEKITDKTKGIFVSPVLGNPPDMDFLKSLCEKHNIKLIGDSCDSIGTKWNDKDLSDFYVAWTSSFYPAHHISTGEGGMISSNIEELKKLFMSFATWGRSCMKFDGAIYTTSGIKNICDIVVGDLVYTHLGNYKMVNELITRKYTGKMYKFKSKKNIDVEFTSEHPLYIERNGLYSWIESKNIIVGDNLVQKIPQQIETPKTFTINYDTLFKNVSFDINVEDDLFRLVGYWLAEGSLAKGNKGSNGKILPSSKGKYLSYRVDFSFHKDETLYIDDVILLMKKYFNVAGWVRKDNGNGVSVEFKSRKGYEFFQKFCNKISYNKKINHNFIHYDKSLLKELIKGFWRGDGSSSKSNFSLSTTSPHLFQQFKLILSRFGINPRVVIVL
jgi:dTDP-4-amino-4,6-dideoxygalactose transaminase